MRKVAVRTAGQCRLKAAMLGVSSTLSAPSYTTTRVSARMRSVPRATLWLDSQRTVASTMLLGRDLVPSISDGRRGIER